MNTKISYKDFRFSKLNTDEFRHLKYLLFWPIFGLMFLFVERFYGVGSYYVMHHPIDDLIPFCEWFAFPYFFWFIYLVGMHLYTLLYDTETFTKMMRYIIFTYSIAIIIYLIFPTCQNLRPVAFERDNLLTGFLTGFYQFDTNTNVCPSIHVMGSLAVMEAALYTKSIKSKWCKVGFVVVAILICLSTIFLKQHSVLDIVAALPFCIIAHIWFYGRRRKK